jgi:hypothetical protein
MKRRKSHPVFRAELAAYKGMMPVNDSKTKERAYLMRFQGGDSGMTIDVVVDRHNATELIETLSEALEEDKQAG